MTSQLIITLLSLAGFGLIVFAIIKLSTRKGEKVRIKKKDLKDVKKIAKKSKKQIKRLKRSTKSFNWVLPKKND